MKKILLLMLILIILIGCNRIGIGTSPAAADKYRSGTQGLRLSFVPNMPPAKIFDNDMFDVVVEVENLGASDAGHVLDKIYLSGFDPSIITGISTTGENIPLIKGRTAFVSTGELDRVHFSGRVSSLIGKNIDRYPVTLLATACYEYDTISSANICIDPDPYAIGVAQKVCRPGSVSLGSQGAPIAISNVQVEPSPGMTRLKITVSNVGGGEVFKNGLDYMNKCSPYTSGFEYDEIGYVEIYDVESGGISIKGTCRPLDNGYLRLTGNTGIIYCELPTSGQAAYVSPLTIHARYGYRSIIFKNVEIISAYS